MKANEAPDKIYASFGVFGVIEATEIRLTSKDIEYIRKDAFIEKALDYIENNIYNHYDGDNEYGICSGYVKKEEFIMNFKNYMKGE